jgi:hypothetical protein
MNYDHTQRGYLHLILYGVALVCLLLARSLPGQPVTAIAPAVVALVMVFFALCFQYLRVRDDGDGLAVRFGPIPLFGTRIRYADITAVAPARSDVLDGWGIHYLLGRGWIYNLWGFDCVRVELGKKIIRIGTDDPVGLAEFLETRRPKAGTTLPVP